MPRSNMSIAAWRRHIISYLEHATCHSNIAGDTENEHDTYTAVRSQGPAASCAQTWMYPRPYVTHIYKLQARSIYIYIYTCIIIYVYTHTHTIAHSIHLASTVKQQPQPTTNPLLPHRSSCRLCRHRLCCHRLCRRSHSLDHSLGRQGCKANHLEMLRYWTLVWTAPK